MKIKRSMQAVTLAVILILAGTSCSSDSTDGAALSLSVLEDMVFTEDGETKMVVVGSRSAWNVRVENNADDWFSCEKLAGNYFSVTAPVNSNEAERTAKLVVYLDNNKESSSVNLIQSGMRKFITLNRTELNVSADGSIFGQGNVHTVTALTSEDVDLTYALEKDSDWITVTETGNKTVSITIDVNPGAARSDNLIFSDANGRADEAVLSIVQLAAEDEDINDPQTYGYTLVAEMRPTESLYNGNWSVVHSYMQSLGWDYTEHPNRDAYVDDHQDEPHMEVVWDNELGMSVYKFISHASSALDGDRGAPSKSNRMRNEMKSRTSTGSAWAHMNGNYGEWQVLEWKMKIPAGFQPTSSFTHIHQLKAHEGTDTDSPVITLSLRSDRNGGNRHVQVINTTRSSAGGKSVYLVNDSSKYPLDKFEGEWLQVQQEVNYKRNGYYRIRITRIRDGEVLMDYESHDVDTWRDRNALGVRNKHGIYRSYDANSEGGNGVAGSLLKDETLLLTDFKVYEKADFQNNTDPQPNDD